MIKKNGKTKQVLVFVMDNNHRLIMENKVFIVAIPVFNFAVIVLS